MGLLSLPIIASQTDNWLYYTEGPTVPDLEPLPDSDVATNRASKKKQKLLSQPLAIPDAPARPKTPPRSKQARPANPPTVIPAGHVEPISKESSAEKDKGAAAPAKLTAADVAQLDSIRKELVELGASKVQLEWIAKSREYLFRCELVLESDPQPITLTAQDPRPVTAAQKVLREALHGPTP